MAVAIQLDFKGGTLAQYDLANQKMGYRPRGVGPKSLLFHWGTKTSDGIRVTDVWNTKEQFEKFAMEQLSPLSKELGLPQPVMQFFEVHNYFTAG